MDHYYTVMIIPDNDKKVKSIKVPKIIIRLASFISVLLLFLIGILSYDYWKILNQVYENKHLTLENRQLKEQIQLFQLKMNTLSEDLKRINTFEQKLRVITGLETNQDNDEEIEDSAEDKKVIPTSTFKVQEDFLKFDNIQINPDYRELKSNYEKKIAVTLGLKKSYTITKEWSELARRSFILSSDYALFDFKYNKLKKAVSEIEVNIHKLDQHLLDQSSLMNSTPTILPTNGWITSYFGERISPYNKLLRMHEGIDVGATPGTPIIAPADGIVVFSGKKAGFGNFVQIDHGYGIETLFAHSRKLYVKSGQKVTRGTLIAGVGNSGHSTGPHLHYEVRVNGIAVDPIYFILDN